MLKDENDYCMMAKDTVKHWADHWLGTVENWSPVTNRGTSQVANLSFIGTYNVMANHDSTCVAGRCSPTCSGEAEAGKNIQKFMDNWVNYPNQTQREKIFLAIKNNHNRLSLAAKIPEIARASEKWQVTCKTCGGNGSNPCRQCGTSGTIRCRTCSGRAKVRCSVCFGHRGKYVPGPGNSQTWYNCAACSGAGEQRCHSCDYAGNERCPGCAGSGKLDCSPCAASGAFSHTLTGYITISMNHKVEIAPVDEKFDALANDVYWEGIFGRFPDFDLDTEIEWEGNLVINEVSAGEYRGDFDGQLPFYFVNMKPDSRFEGPETTTIFAGRKFYPISFGYIFDTTVNKLVTHGSRDVNTGKNDIRKWTASRMGCAVHDRALGDSGQTIMERLSGISENARDILLEGFDDLANQFREPERSMDLGQLLKKTLSFSLRGYFICMVIGMLALIFSTQYGNPYAINWDIVGFSSAMQMIVLLTEATVFGWIFYDLEFVGILLVSALVLLGLFRVFLAGPKPWSKTKFFFGFILAYIIGAGIVGIAMIILPYEAYYVFPTDYTVGYFSMILSELLGVVSMIPEIIMVSAVVAYFRIRKAQSDDVLKTLDEIESPTLKQQLGFVKS